MHDLIHETNAYTNEEENTCNIPSAPSGRRRRERTLLLLPSNSLLDVNSFSTPFPFTFPFTPSPQMSSLLFLPGYQQTYIHTLSLFPPKLRIKSTTGTLLRVSRPVHTPYFFPNSCQVREPLYRSQMLHACHAPLLLRYLQRLVTPCPSYNFTWFLLTHVKRASGLRGRIHLFGIPWLLFLLEHYFFDSSCPFDQFLHWHSLT